jgi:hypothetical protein
MTLFFGPVVRLPLWTTVKPAVWISMAAFAGSPPTTFGGWQPGVEVGVAVAVGVGVAVAVGFVWTSM